jgi:hypothetical protein
LHYFLHNFLRFMPIFGGKSGVFLKNQCYDQKSANLALVWVKNAIFRCFFPPFFFVFQTFCSISSISLGSALIFGCDNLHICYKYASFWNNE